VLFINCRNGILSAITVVILDGYEHPCSCTLLVSRMRQIVWSHEVKIDVISLILDKSGHGRYLDTSIYILSLLMTGKKQSISAT